MFGYHHPHSGLELSIISVTRDLQAPEMHVVHIYAFRLNTNTHKFKNTFGEELEGRNDI